MAVPPPALPARVAAVGPDTADPSIAAALEAALADLPVDFDPEAYVPPARVARLLAASDESLPALVQQVDMATGFPHDGGSQAARGVSGIAAFAALLPGKHDGGRFQGGLGLPAQTASKLDLRMTQG
ncbi:hypothetical protein AMAG_04633 [Allomyces macrogynus ATCC 38327]|uniref:Uncharacterized protein n=1 Tax=Allomyces macrogynus (strain ATCC 38327) TaxID=578462 RepID=A0A0L0S5J7_ALLM3|nr:hypothetical protein AMAG_04633 [Allomyces macrogynus ATCC 38327]|eukprot:KNE57782.1 hypothetical protein AMAG_04633 [Allomyces macrogynus ATCC 38327]